MTRYVVYLLASVILSLVTIVWLLWRHPLPTLLVAVLMVGIVYLMAPARSNARSAAVSPNSGNAPIT